MRILLLTILSIISISAKSQLIRDERYINWVYGIGNSDISLVFNGAWNPNFNSEPYVYKLQINNSNILVPNDSGLWCEIPFKRFDQSTNYLCLRESSMDTVVRSPYNTGNGTNIQSYIRQLGYGNYANSKANIIPGTFSLTAGSQVVYDDSNGNLIGSISAASTIDYGFTGNSYFNVKFLTNVASATTIVATYTVRIQTINNNSAFITIGDLTPGNYNFYFKDGLGYVNTFQDIIEASETLTSKESTLFNYTNQLTTIP